MLYKTGVALASMLLVAAAEGDCGCQCGWGAWGWVGGAAGGGVQTQAFHNCPLALCPKIVMHLGYRFTYGQGVGVCREAALS